MQATRHIQAALLALACAPVWAQTDAGTAVSFGMPVAGTELSELRGGTDVTVNDLRLNGATTGNTAENVQTGRNVITDGALSNMSGIPMVIQNTGANVLIQNALILNVKMQ